MLEERKFLKKMYRQKCESFPKLSHTSSAVHDYFYKKGFTIPHMNSTERSYSKSIYDIITTQKQILPSQSMNCFEKLPSISYRSGNLGRKTSKSPENIKEMRRELRMSHIAKLAIPRNISPKYVAKDSYKKRDINRLED